jgi:arylsulfatase
MLRPTQGTLRIWAEPFTKLRVPKLFNLRSDPYERADVTSNTYYDWFMSDGAGVFIAAPVVVGKFLETFKEYPPSQRPSSFSIDQVVEKMQKIPSGPSSARTRFMSSRPSTTLDQRVLG